MITYSVDDISTWNPGISGYSFSITKITENDYCEDDVQNLESFINDQPSANFADQFNLEYMSFLTGTFRGTKRELIEFVNIYFQKDVIKHARKRNKVSAANELSKEHNLKHDIIGILKYFENGLSDVEEGSGDKQPMLKEIRSALKRLHKINNL